MHVTPNKPSVAVYDPSHLGFFVECVLTLSNSRHLLTPLDGMTVSECPPSSQTPVSECPPSSPIGICPMDAVISLFAKYELPFLGGDQCLCVSCQKTSISSHPLRPLNLHFHQEHPLCHWTKIIVCTVLSHSFPDKKEMGCKRQHCIYISSTCPIIT